ncbi:Acetyl-coenzyme A carboxylase carboxyl transferase subunit beta [Poriferisphaera corsica]|uniref:Acetyl-coenzyme A carboxylase carboxyl transferase subunit beta n=1 Tax=Poriferisphaera corsica TaxID=2528020 RepID=A0A517YRZ6_9BACT|nr:acetyl-CoA carboxylase, carboxyltransferase subunit beta [Poriferisphaera corsica]QDU32988.1 Acetyl-coenzyme A carboxylase carboxyl transferase subunit beta [Poriferisphaera corsica]
MAEQQTKTDSDTNNNPPTSNGARTWQDLKQSDVPEGLWMRCPKCEAMCYQKQVTENLEVCPECDHHYRVGADQRIEQILDPSSFEPLWEDIGPVDALDFVDRIPYAERIEKEQTKTGHKDALICGKGFVKGRGVVIAVMDTRFMMASMGSVVGEKITRCIELATETDRPFILVSASGGARMQESSLSLSQMAKTSAALARFDDLGGLFISILTDPTTGGVTASYAMLGDVIIAEPKALIGFAGPRVIANTVRQELPDGFQRAEFLLQKGFLDRVVHRKELRSEVARLIDYAGK